VGRDGEQTEVRVAVGMSGWWMDEMNATYSWLYFCFPSLVAERARTRGPVMVSSSAVRWDE
jgi:hypothetical protein